MSEPYLIIDGNNLAWRSYYAFKTLSAENVKTGVLFGFFKGLIALQETHCTSRAIFTFDVGRPLRKKDFPAYKNRNPEKDPRKEKARAEVHRQIELLYTDYLPRIGYRNIFYKAGFEADDIIGKLCQRESIRTGRREAIIASSDQDLYQLLNKNVLVWNTGTGTAVTAKSLQKTTGLTPAQWVHFKAMAGCHSDKIPGLPGIGETRALEYLTGVAPDHVCEKIETAQRTELWPLMLRLVTLPYPGTPTFRIVSNEFDLLNWKHVTSTLKMKTLTAIAPRH